MTNAVDRRKFIQISALATGGFVLSFVMPANAKSRGFTASPRSKVLLTPFLRIEEDNSIYVILSKVEMGQGINTTLPILIAEELEVSLAKIKIENISSGSDEDFKQPLFVQTTGGSDSTKSEFNRYRKAGATARLMLVNAAAKRAGIRADSCRTEDGFVVAGEMRFSYGELANEASNLPVPKEIKLKEPGAWKVIGKPQKRLDTPAKISGKTMYGIDIRFDGLLTALVAHPPVIGGKVKSFDAQKALLVKGVKELLQIPTGVAVIADNFWAAKQGRDALTIEWDVGDNEQIDSKKILEDYLKLAETEGVVIERKGDVKQALQNAVKSINAQYSFPFLAHAPMETLNCTVKISPEKCKVWAATQSPWLHQQEVAAFLGLKPEQVEWHTPEMGGSFGRRGSLSGDWIMEAVHIAKLNGKAIKLIWTREDDIQGGYYRPIYLHDVKVGVNEEGFPIAWQHKIIGQSLFTGTALEKDIVFNGIDYSSITKGVPYTNSIADQSFELITTRNDVTVLPWRSVGNTHNVFVIETLIDELANLANTETVAYRRKLLKDSPRHLAALNLAVEKSNWFSPLPKGRYKGIAVHDGMGSYIAQAVEISIVNGAIRVHKVICAIDCGLAVNPAGVVAQMEGSIVYGLSAALFGEISIEKGRVQQSNFHDYRVLRMNEMPTIEVHIVLSSQPMGGAGEPAVAIIAPALANAVFAATGRRLRNLPLRT